MTKAIKLATLKPHLYPIASIIGPDTSIPIPLPKMKIKKQVHGTCADLNSDTLIKC